MSNESTSSSVSTESTVPTVGNPATDVPVKSDPVTTAFQRLIAVAQASFLQSKELYNSILVIVDNQIESAVEDVVEDKVSREIESTVEDIKSDLAYDIESAIDDIDFEDKCEGIIERSVDSAIREVDIDDKIEDVLARKDWAEEIGSEVTETVDNKVDDLECRVTDLEGKIESLIEALHNV